MVVDAVGKQGDRRQADDAQESGIGARDALDARPALDVLGLEKDRATVSRLQRPPEEVSQPNSPPHGEDRTVVASEDDWREESHGR